VFIGLSCAGALVVDCEMRKLAVDDERPVECRDRGGSPSYPID
jgi:hypothetical protein